jgi:serine protease
MNSSSRRFQRAAAVVWLCILAAPAAAEVVRAVEYYHQAFEHYFVTANPAEIAALDSGAVSGWWRTGQRYRVDDAPAEGLVPVCRFYTAAYAGKASHFFTASATECEHVKTMPDWTYGGTAFQPRQQL